MAVNTDIFLGSGASLTFVPEVDLCITLDTSSTTTRLDVDDLFKSKYLLVPNLYVGCTLDLYDAAAPSVSVSTHIITANTTDDITISPAHTHGTLADAADFAVIRGYGAPCPSLSPASNKIRLNADNWLGLIESATFPNVDQEMKQLNLSLGGSRNFTHQYKGIKTASGGNINLVANHGAWLYYALGQCTNVNCTLTDATPDANGYNAETADDVYINSGAGESGPTDVDSHTNTGPIFYRTAKSSTILTPPVAKHLDTISDLEQLTRSTNSAGENIATAITYTFEELNGADLPSFALEQSIAKNPETSLFTEGSTTESNTFVRIARGNRVNTLTMTANENEEVKMTMDLNTSAVHSINNNTTTKLYEARAGQKTNTNLFNYAPSSAVELLEPFFFSKGSFSIFGQQFLKMTNFTLTINNNLIDKRFVGMGSKDIKSALPAQRTYELTFTGLVTDDKLFEEIFNETENTATTPSGSGVISLQFDKDNGEQIAISLTDYHLSGSTWTVPEDKGPITVDATVMPRNLNTCTVKTHWVLQG